MGGKTLLGLVALALLCLLCLWCHAPAIEETIRAGSGEALAAMNLPDAKAVVSGRDVTLQGLVATDADRDRAEAAVRELDGVRTVFNRLEIASAAPATSVTASSASSEAGTLDAMAKALGFQTRGDRISLTGLVPSEDRRSGLVADAVASWGEENVEDRLTVDADADASGWPLSFAGLMGALKSRGLDIDLSLLGNKLSVKGNLLSELTRDRLLGALRAALPGIEIEDGLELREAEGEAEALQAALDKNLRGKLIEFASGGDRLTPRGKTVLDELAGVLRESDGRVELSGHTDSQGADQMNLDLSRRRASAAAAYLVTKGFQADRFTTVGFGESRPIADNETAEGRQRNRRTEVRALEEK